jgi:hypothetical protein
LANFCASQAYLRQLQENPLRTKMLTSGGLSGLQEFLASWIAHDKNKSGNYFTSRVPKMALYGAFISAPLGHVLINMLQWFFQGKTSVRAKVMQILASNLIVRFRQRHDPAVQTKLMTFPVDRAYPEQRVSHFDGNHRRSPHSAPGPSHGQSWLLARYEGQLDHVAHLLGLRPAVPPTRNVGSVLQPGLVCHRHLHQPAHQEEEIGCFAKEGLRRRQRQAVPDRPPGRLSSEAKLLNIGTRQERKSSITALTTTAPQISLEHDLTTTSSTPSARRGTVRCCGADCRRAAIRTPAYTTPLSELPHTQSFARCKYHGFFACFRIRGSDLGKMGWFKSIRIPIYRNRELL